MSVEKAPTTFISYAHYDGSDNFRPRVFALSERLRQNGVDCRIDQYEENDPPSNWARWMNDAIQNAQAVLVVFSNTYRVRFEGREEEGLGLGATWEGGAITTEIYNKGGGKHKFIPLTFGPRSLTQSYIPSPLDATTSYDVESDADFDRLLRRLHDVPEVTMGQLGSRPKFDSVQSSSPDVIADAHRVTRRVLREPGHAIALHELLQDSITTAVDRILQQKFSKGAPEPNSSSYVRRVQTYEHCLEELASRMAELAFYGAGEDLRHLTVAQRSLFNSEVIGGHIYYAWDHLWNYPAAFCLYAAGSAASLRTELCGSCKPDP